MASDTSSPAREGTPAAAVAQKRLEDDHIPAVSSPLNPDFAKGFKEDAPTRAARAKKESLKKRESKGTSLAPELTSVSTPDTSTPTKKAEDTLAPLRYKLPPPKPSDVEAPQGPIMTPHHTITAPDGTEVEFQEPSDHVYNKKNFRYTHAIADPAFPSSQCYRQSEAEPFTARFNFEDTSAHMYLDKTGCHITTDKGYRMGKANVCAREGRWYYECKITQGIQKAKPGEMGEPPHGHVRMGWARREATLEAPVGFDCYSYGLRDQAGQKMFMSRPKDFFPPGENIEEGDVIGLEINLPSESLHRKVVEGHYNPAVDLEDDDTKPIEAADVIRDRVPIRFKSHLYFEQIDYEPIKELEDLNHPSAVSSSAGSSGSTQAPSPTHPNPAFRTLPFSNIKIYKNGHFVGTAFTDLLAFLPPASSPDEKAQVGARVGLDDGMLGYFPAVSVFRGGAAELNFGPDFWFPPAAFEDNEDEVDMIGSDQLPAAKSSKPKPMSERYDEQIAEDIVRDLVDEVAFWFQDGGGLGNAIGVDSAQTTSLEAINGLEAMPSDEIKELVQDDE